MIAVISKVLPAASATKATTRQTASTASRTGWAFQPMPNLSREVRQAIGKVRAGWTFTTICTELGYACYQGRATWGQQRLGIGLRALARESGQSLGKVRRDCAALAELGLVVISTPNVLHVSDPATGRIVRKSNGRCEATLIYLTITEACLRPSKGQHGTKGGTTVAPPPAACKGHGGTTVREETIQQRTPVGDAGGTGTPLAVEAGRLPAAEAPATTPILPVAAGRDEPPMPAGRITPAPRSSTTSRRPDHHRDLDAPRPWDQASQDAKARTLARLAREEEARRRQDEEWRAERERIEAEIPPPSPTTTPEPVADIEVSEEVRMIQEVIERKRAAEAAMKAIEGKAKAEAYRDTYHREKAAGAA